MLINNAKKVFLRHLIFILCSFYLVSRYLFTFFAMSQMILWYSVDIDSDFSGGSVHPIGCETTDIKEICTLIDLLLDIVSIETYAGMFLLIH